MYQITKFRLQAYKEVFKTRGEILTVAITGSAFSILSLMGLFYEPGAAHSFLSLALISVIFLLVGRTYVLNIRAQKAAARFYQNDLEPALLPFFKHTLLERPQRGEAGEKTFSIALLKEEHSNAFEFVNIEMRRLSGLSRTQTDLLKKAFEDLILISHRKSFRHARVRLELNVSFNDALSAHERLRLHQETQDLDTPP